MSQAEFERWQLFYTEQPFDDLHRYHRPAALLAKASGGREQFSEYVKMLVNDSSKPEASDADMNTFAAFGMKPPANWGQ